jgi:hypothetical protein
MLKEKEKKRPYLWCASGSFGRLVTSCAASELYTTRKTQNALASSTDKLIFFDRLIRLGGSEHFSIHCLEKMQEY